MIHILKAESNTVHFLHPSITILLTLKKKYDIICLMQIGSMVVRIWNEANFHSKNDISSRIYQTFPSEKHYHFM